MQSKTDFKYAEGCVYVGNSILFHIRDVSICKFGYLQGLWYHAPTNNEALMQACFCFTFTEFQITHAFASVWH